MSSNDKGKKALFWKPKEKWIYKKEEMRDQLSLTLVL